MDQSQTYIIDKLIDIQERTLTAILKLQNAAILTEKEHNDLLKDLNDVKKNSYEIIALMEKTTNSTIVEKIEQMSQRCHPNMGEIRQMLVDQGKALNGMQDLYQLVWKLALGFGAIITAIQIGFSLFRGGAEQTAQDILKELQKPGIHQNGKTK